MIDKRILDRLSPITEEERKLLEGNQKGVDWKLYSNRPGREIQSEKFLEDGKNITIRPHTRFVEFPEHTHNFIEMVYVCTGEAVHTINGTTLHLQAGELLILGRKARQKIAPAGEKDISVNFFLRPEFLTSVLRFLGDGDAPLKNFLIDCLCGEEGGSWFYFRVADLLPVQNLVENLLWTFLHKVPNRRELYQTTMGLLFLELLNYAETLKTETGDTDLMIRLLDYIENHYREGTLMELASRTHYEIHWLSANIRKKTGKTFTELMQIRRMTQAKWMLLNTEKSVEEIAYAVGYENKSYFYRLFASTWGQTPKQLRKSVTKDTL